MSENRNDEVESQNNDNTENSVTSEKNTLNQLLGIKLFDYFKEDPTAKVAILTALITFTAFIIKLIGYLYLKGYLSVYNISVNNVNYTSSNGLLYFMFNALLFLGFAFSTGCLNIFLKSLYLKIAVCKLTHNTPSIKMSSVHQMSPSIFSMLISLLVIFGVNYLIIIYVPSPQYQFPIAQDALFIRLLSIFFIEFVTLFLIHLENRIRFRQRKHKSGTRALSSEKEYINNFPQKDIPKIITKLENIIYTVQPTGLQIILDKIACSSIALLIFYFAVISYVAGISSAKGLETYKMINESYTIVYQSDQQYWLVESSEFNNELFLDTSVQKIIPLENVEIRQKEFDEIHFIKH